MRTLSVLACALALTGATGYFGIKRADGKSTEQPSPDRQTRAVVDATRAFLTSLTPNQRQEVQFAFTPQRVGANAPFHRTADGGVAPGAPSEGQKNHPASSGAPSGQSREPGDSPGGPGGRPGGRFGMGPPGGFIGEQYGRAVWSNYPVSDVLRPGLRLGSLTTEQRAAAMHLLETVLSPMGYEKVLDIMGSDQALTDAGTNFASGEAVYTIGIFGEPSASKPWMLEFGGHHLGLNVVIGGARGVMTPTLTGAQPSVYKRGDRTIRVLARENDTAFALLNALTEQQRKQAILNYE